PITCTQTPQPERENSNYEGEIVGNDFSDFCYRVGETDYPGGMRSGQVEFSCQSENKNSQG
ncbi:MAG: hypothetical protein ACREEM_41730, partial [Blastocatellia bacterium]